MIWHAYDRYNVEIQILNQCINRTELNWTNLHRWAGVFSVPPIKFTVEEDNWLTRLPFPDLCNGKVISIARHGSSLVITVADLHVFISMHGFLSINQRGWITCYKLMHWQAASYWFMWDSSLMTAESEPLPVLHSFSEQALHLSASQLLSAEDVVGAKSFIGYN